jgi:hypothetical protein
MQSEAFIAARGNLRALKSEPKGLVVALANIIDSANNVHLTVQHVWSSVILRRLAMSMVFLPDVCFCWPATMGKPLTLAITLN